ncbi:MAG: monovalent cation/H(+) antiporter subunit G [Alphaproteobacteria bacterium]|nr:monovalent cation/H(+) antiporter subunit G [Alphaproteobacteria bacterium]
MEYFGWGLIFIGCIFNLLSAIGCLKITDSYTMIHAAGIGDSCGTPIILFGVIFVSGFNILSFKILLLVAMVILLSPTATHALARAGLEEGQRK